MSEEFKEVNEILFTAFENIKETVRRIQYWLEDEWLRVNVVSDFSKGGRSKYIIEQLGTAFCIISLGKDDKGEFSIALSIDKQINEKIGYYFSTILLRRLFEFIPESCAHNVRIVNFSKDCVQYLEIVIEEHKRGEVLHDISVIPYEDS